MGAISISRRFGHAAVVAGVLMVSACSEESAEPSIAEADSSAARSVAVAATAAAETTEDTVAVLADPGVNPEGVIFAAIALATGGDVDAGLADGAFTRADLDAARAGIDDGSLAYLFE